MNRGAIVSARAAIGAFALLVAVAGGAYFLLKGPPDHVPGAATVLEDDFYIGKRSAPIVIVAYTSLSCTDCAAFHAETLPAIKREWIDTGKAVFISRDVPTDDLAVMASALLVYATSGGAGLPLLRLGRHSVRPRGPLVARSVWGIRRYCSGARHWVHALAALHDPALHPGNGARPDCPGSAERNPIRSNSFRQRLAGAGHAHLRRASDRTGGHATASADQPCPPVF